jgi:hypothetical protein
MDPRDVDAGLRVHCFYTHADRFAAAVCTRAADVGRRTVHVSFEEWELELEAPVAYLRPLDEHTGGGGYDDGGEIETVLDEEGQPPAEATAPAIDDLAHAAAAEAGEGGDDDDDDHDDGALFRQMQATERLDNGSPASGSGSGEDNEDEREDEDGDAMRLLSGMAAESFADDDDPEDPKEENEDEEDDELEELFDEAKVDFALLSAVAKACGGTSSRSVAAAGEKAIAAAGVPSLKARKLCRAAAARVAKQT